MRRYYKWFAGIGVAAMITASLMYMDRQHNKAAAPAATPPAGSSSSVDSVHELIALQEDLKKKPEHPPILFRMAQLASEQGKTADAISYLQRLLKVDAGNTEARLELGRLLYQSNDIQGAMRETSKILETNPKQVDALYNLGAIYANLSQPAVARTFWNRAVASAPSSDSGKLAAQALQKLGSQTMVHP